MIPGTDDVFYTLGVRCVGDPALAKSEILHYLSLQQSNFDPFFQRDVVQGVRWHHLLTVKRHRYSCTTRTFP